MFNACSGDGLDFKLDGCRKCTWEELILDFFKIEDPIIIKLYTYFL